jgi:hypothetical protein
MSGPQSHKLAAPLEGRQPVRHQHMCVNRPAPDALWRRKMTPASKPSAAGYAMPDGGSLELTPLARTQGGSARGDPA